MTFATLCPFLTFLHLQAMWTNILAADLSLTADFLMSMCPLSPSCLSHPCLARAVGNIPVTVFISLIPTFITPLRSLDLEHAGVSP